jgi:hypothetical protein
MRILRPCCATVNRDAAMATCVKRQLEYVPGAAAHHESALLVKIHNQPQKLQALRRGQCLVNSPPGKVPTGSKAFNQRLPAATALPNSSMMRFANPP